MRETCLAHIQMIKLSEQKSCLCVEKNNVLNSLWPAFDGICYDTETKREKWVMMDDFFSSNSQKGMQEKCSVFEMWRGKN